MNLSAYVVRGQTQDSLYSETLYYGVDASGEAPWSVPAHPDHHWSSFNELFDHPQEVAQSYHYAIDALAAKIARNVTMKAPSAAVRSAGR